MRFRSAVLQLQLLPDGPRARPGRRIVDRDDVLQRRLVDPAPALDQMEVFAGAAVAALRGEVRDVDHQRVAFPVAAGVSERRADVARQMPAPVDRDDALPSLSLAHVVEDRQRAGWTARCGGTRRSWAARRPCSVPSGCGPPDRRCGSAAPCCRTAAPPRAGATAARTTSRRRPAPAAGTSRWAAAAPGRTPVRSAGAPPLRGCTAECARSAGPRRARCDRRWAESTRRPRCRRRERRAPSRSARARPGAAALPAGRRAPSVARP